MASASDEDLAAMVQNWQNLQQEQKDASDSIGELESGLSEAMDNTERRSTASRCQDNNWALDWL